MTIFKVLKNQKRKYMKDYNIAKKIKIFSHMYDNEIHEANKISTNC